MAMGRMKAKGKKDAAAIKEHADSLSDKGRLDEAIEEYKASILLEPSDPCSHFGLGDAYFKKGLREEAVVEVREAMRLRPGWPFYHSKLGAMMEAFGRSREAEEEYGEALRLKPDLEAAREGLARLKKSSKR